MQAVRSKVLVTSSSSQVQPAGLSGGGARATATRPVVVPPPLELDHRRASWRWACRASGPAEHATGYLRASPRYGTDARRCFLRKDGRSLVWGPLTGLTERPAGTRQSPFQSGAPVILRGRHGRSSEGIDEGTVHIADRGGSSADPAKEKSASAGCPQDFHVPSTGFPQQGFVRFVRSALAPGM
jgi:hypothetical protein